MNDSSAVEVTFLIRTSLNEGKEEVPRSLKGGETSLHLWALVRPVAAPRQVEEEKGRVWVVAVPGVGGGELVGGGTSRGRGGEEKRSICFCASLLHKVVVSTWCVVCVIPRIYLF